jgi:hypothetical protein
MEKGLIFCKLILSLHREVFVVDDIADFLLQLSCLLFASYILIHAKEDNFLTYDDKICNRKH